MSVQQRIFVLASCLVSLAACGGTSTLPPAAQTTPAAPTTTSSVSVERVAVPKEQPPAGGAARDIHFPPIARATTTSGLEVNTVTLHGLPALQVKLVVKSGSASDPEDMPGMAELVAQMLKEGTTKKSSAKIAETVDFLGARLGISNDEEHVEIDMKALSDQLKDALSLVAELATQPTFDEKELAKLKKRELDRLSLMSQSPSFLARREFYKALYGNHPYAHVDTTKDVVKRVRRSALQRWHQQHFAPNNAYLVIVGDVTPDAVMAAANRAFKDWAPRKLPEFAYPPVPTRGSREIVLVDRPDSVQSVIYVGNVALARKDPAFVPLTVANEVLGGSAAARLFMDLRERQSLTYGAYSDVDTGLQPVPFRAFAAVRNEVTAQAMKALMGHLARIAAEPAGETELTDAKRLLIDSFPLHIETSGEIAGLISELRAYGFPDNYWDGYRAEIQAVNADQALTAAKQYIRADKALIVVVGKAAAVKEALSAYGPVRVIDTDGKVLVDTVAAHKTESTTAVPAPTTPTPAAPTTATTAPAATAAKAATATAAPAAAAPAAPTAPAKEK
jgi:zinc protease